MKNHGITVGSSEGISRAMDILEMTEMMALSVSVALNAGKISTIPIEEVEKLDNTIKARGILRPGNPAMYKLLKSIYS